MVKILKGRLGKCKKYWKALQMPNSIVLAPKLARNLQLQQQQQQQQQPTTKNDQQQQQQQKQKQKQNQQQQ